VLRVNRIARAVAGLLAGFLAGVGVTLALLVADARFRGHYLETVGDALGWPIVPVVLGPIVGAWLGRRGGATARSVALGAALDPHISAGWAGGTIGCGAGILAGAAVGGWRARRR